MAVASHNLRSVSHAIAYNRLPGGDDTDLELQVLRGLGDPLQPALAAPGLRVRTYCPVGDLVAGMAYLVRRLLENTSNESLTRRTNILEDLKPPQPIELQQPTAEQRPEDRRHDSWRTPPARPAYMRVSKLGERDPDAANFQAIPQQRTAIEHAVALRPGAEVIEWIEDLNQSGGTMDRPGLTRALELVDDEANGNIVVEVDRRAHRPGHRCDHQLKTAEGCRSAPPTTSDNKSNGETERSSRA